MLLFALPVILIDELLKMLGRRFFGVEHVVPHWLTVKHTLLPFLSMQACSIVQHQTNPKLH